MVSPLVVMTLELEIFREEPVKTLSALKWVFFTASTELDFDTQNSWYFIPSAPAKVEVQCLAHLFMD